MARYDGARQVIGGALVLDGVSIRAGEQPPAAAETRRSADAIIITLRYHDRR